MSVPDVSIVMPVYQRPEFLAAAVRSVRAQTFDDWELLIGDDGSTGATREVLAGLRSEPRVQVIELAHSGNPAKVRNAALRIARGRLVAFLDSDDWWVPAKLERQRAHLQAMSTRWSYTGFIHVDAQGQLIDDQIASRCELRSGFIFAETVAGRVSIRTPTVMVERALLESAGGFDESLVSGHDYDLWMRLALYHEVAVLAEPLAAVRVNRDSHSSRWPPRALEYRDLSLNKLAGLAGHRWLAHIARQRRRNAAALAASYRAQGAYALMRATIRRSLPNCWHDPRWWWASARTLARATRPRAQAGIRNAATAPPD